MGCYYYDLLKQLFGGKIIGAFASDLTQDNPNIIDINESTEWQNIRDHFVGLFVLMPDGSTKGMLIMSDEEGNGPGSVDISDISMSKEALADLLTKLSSSGVSQEKAVINEIKEVVEEVKKKRGRPRKNPQV